MNYNPLTIRLYSVFLTTCEFTSSVKNGGEGWLSVPTDSLSDWLSEITPTATYKPFFDHIAITFKSETDLIMFQLAFSDELCPT